MKGIVIENIAERIDDIISSIEKSQNEDERNWYIDAFVSLFYAELLSDKQKEKFLNNSTPQNACLYEKYAITASYITKSNRIIKPLPAEEQRETRKKLIDDIKNMNMSVSGIDKSILIICSF